MTEEILQTDTTDARPGEFDGVSRRTLLKASGIGAGGLALGASAGPASAQEEDEGSANDDPAERLAEARIPYLHLDTLEADFEGETLQAESYQDWRPGSTTYVGMVPNPRGRDLFAGVSLLEDTDQYEEDAQPELIAYLCDGEPGTQATFGFHLEGNYDDGGVTLTDEDAEEFEELEVAVKLAMVDGEFLGATTLLDGESASFLATEVTGDAGIYRAVIGPEEGTFIQWVALPDGSQRGVIICPWCPLGCLFCPELQ